MVKPSAGQIASNYQRLGRGLRYLEERTGMGGGGDTDESKAE